MTLLFICKKRELTDPNPDSYCYSGARENSSGLYNSARLVAEQLNNVGVESIMEQAADNNCIDRLVSLHKPTHVIIEALWVVPSKFAILAALHPNVKWIIRLHSETPFLAGEGVAINWLFEYLEQPNVTLAANSTRLVDELSHIMNTKVIHLPNYYGTTPSDRHLHREKTGLVKVGCFGAIRPLKNHLIQAFAAIKFADDIDRTLQFYINGTRIEMQGSEPLKNLRALFYHHPRHELIEIPWKPHAEFLDIVRQMDIGLQVSFTETFNIVGADMVNNDIPVVVSPEVQWCDNMFKADPTSWSDIVKKLRLAWDCRTAKIHDLNKQGLKKNGEDAIRTWATAFAE